MCYCASLTCITFITFVTCINCIICITCFTCIIYNAWLLVVLVYLYYIYFYTDLIFSVSRTSHQIFSWDIIEIAGFIDRLYHRNILLHKLYALFALLVLLVYLYYLDKLNVLKHEKKNCQWPNYFLSESRFFFVIIDSKDASACQKFTI